MSLKMCIKGFLVLVVAAVCSGQTSHGETADPEAHLKPRNFNPHPFESVSSSESRPVAVDVDGNAVGSDSDDVPAVPQIVTNHLRRRQSGVYNQGPIQFPNDNTNEINRGVGPRFVLKQGRRLPEPTQPSGLHDYEDYDQQGDSSSLSKKHYAFSYVVRDHESGDDFSHSQQQQKDGGVQGSYKVQLPDGRTQVVKYTADNDGYKADVSYIENTIDHNPSPSHPQQHQYLPTPSASPISNYYENPHQYQPKLFTNIVADRRPNQLSYERLSGGYELPRPKPQHSHTVPQHQAAVHPQSLASTPKPYLAHAPATSAAFVTLHRPVHSNYVDLQNVEIGTYNTAPHQQSHLHGAGRIVFPTSPTMYNDIHVLPSPRPYPYATTAPFSGLVSPKSTNIVSSPATYEAHRPVAAVATVASPADYYLDYNSNYQQPSRLAQLQHSHDQPQQYFVATAAVAPQRGPNSAHTAHANSAVLIRPDQALYYKHSKK